MVTSTVRHSMDYDNRRRVQPYPQTYKKGRQDCLGSKLDAGLDANLTNRFGWTLLMIAALDGRSDMTDLLLTRGADPNRVNQFGDTASSVAKMKGFNKLAATLALHQNKGNE